MHKSAKAASRVNLLISFLLYLPIFTNHRLEASRSLFDRGLPLDFNFVEIDKAKLLRYLLVPA